MRPEGPRRVHLRAPAAALGLAFLVACAACRAPHIPAGVAAVRELTAVAEPRGPRLLCVVAHPDDEIAFAGTLYQNALALGGFADVAVITNGEGGFKYATLSEPFYGLALSDEATGRARLPAIRREELAEGCRILRVRRLFFLDQRDHRYTQDPGEVLDPGARVWDLPRVERALAAILRAEDYDFVLTLMPTLETHGHHKAATILALRALESLPPERRPVALCARTVSLEGPEPEPFDALEGYPRTRVSPAVFAFDRTRPLGYQGRLSYRIVANWAIAAHKSQGTLQLLTDAADLERYRVFATGRDDAEERARAFFEALRGDPFPPRSYGPSAGTNTGR